MADRSVTVRLRAEISDYQRKLAAASATTAGFVKSLDGGDAAIDKFSGRLRLFADAALTLGPALVPLGAATIPVLTGALVGLGAAAGGLGAGVLALQGVGDALSALDDYQAAPTAEGLAKVRAEMEKLGPAGADFVRFLDGIEPELKSLQTAAREGLLPGLEDGISSVLTDLPQIRDLVNQLAEAMGRLSADAGADLAGPEWEAFFDYLRTDAAPALEQLGRTVGNFAQGFANMLVGFAPATRDFSGGLEDMSRRFAEWSAGLENNDSFQDFVAYVRESGPQAVKLLAELAQALAGLAQAMAPYGAVVLPALTGVLDLFGMIASSDIGPVLIAAAAGMTAFNRAASLATGSLGKAGVALAGNPWGIAAAGLTVAVTQIVAADDELVAATRRAQDALDSGNTTQMQTALDDLNVKLDETKVRMYEAVPESFVDRFAEGIPVVGQFGNAIDQAGGLWAKFSGAEEDAARKAEALEDALAGRGFLGIRATILGAADSLAQYQADAEEAEGATSDFEDAIRRLNGTLDRREALRNYLQGIADFNAMVKEGKSTRREMNGSLDDIARNAAQVAEGLAGADKKQFLTRARQDFVDAAIKLGRTKAAAEGLADKLFGLDRAEAEPRVGADTKAFDRAMSGAERGIKHVDGLKAEPTISADASRALAAIKQVMGWLNAIPDEHVNVYIDRVGTMGGPGRADGGTIPGKRQPYGDKGLYMLAPGEEVISNRRGQADRHRALLKKINAGLADGGTSRGPLHQYLTTPGSGTYGGPGDLSPALNGIKELKDALKKFSKQLDEATKAVDREKRQRDELIAASEAFAAAVGGAYAKADPFSGGLSDFDTATSANTNDSNAAKAALAAAAAQGLDGPLYQALAASGNLGLLQEFAGLSAAQIEIREQQYASQSQAQAGLGSAAATHEFAQAIKDQTKELKEAQKERQKYAQLVKEVERRLDQLPDRVERGARAGVGDRDRRTAAGARAGG